MPAALSCSADVVLVADADVWTDGIQHAVAAVLDGHPWAIPHGRVVRLCPEGTRRYMAGEPADERLTDQRPYEGIEGGGIVALAADVLRAVPLDPRFEGWGQEDESWAVALRELAGPPWRGTADLIHLWHPPQPRWTRRRGSPESWHLRRRYFNARGNPTAMRTLLAEAHAALEAPCSPTSSPAT